MTEAADWSHPFPASAHQVYIFISHSGRFGRILCLFSMTEAEFPLKALFYVHIFVSVGCQLCYLLYPVCQLHHVCRVDAEEDVQDFRQLRPGLDSPQVVVLLLTSPKFSAIAWSGSSKISYFDMQIYFAIPPNSVLHGLLEEFFFSISNI